MKRLIYVLFVGVFLLGGTNVANAQLNGLVNKAKDKADKDLDIEDMKDACIRLKNAFEREIEDSDRYLKKESYDNARSNMENSKKRLEEYKSEPCPFVKKLRKQYKAQREEVNNAQYPKEGEDFIVKGVVKRNKELIEEVLKYGGDINKKGHFVVGRNLISGLPLEVAIKDDNLDMVKFLVDKGAKVDQKGSAVHLKDKPYMVMDYAIDHGNEEIIDYLMEQSSSVGNKYYRLSNAASAGNLNVYKKLVKELDAKPFMEKTYTDDRGVERKATTLCSAEDENNEEIAEYIRKELLKEERSKITNSTHKENIGRIVFSDKKISATDDADNFTRKLNAADPIYGMLYLPTKTKYMRINRGDCLGDWNPKYYEVWAMLEKDEKKYKVAEVSIGNKYAESSVIPVKINTEENDRYLYRKFFSRLENGENKGKIEVVLGFEDITYKDDIVFVRKEGEVYEIDKSFADYEAGMDDPELEKKILEAANRLNTERETKKEFKKVKIKSNGWSSIRHSKTGVLMGRRIYAYCYGKTPQGYCVVQKIGFKQEHTGSDYSSRLKLYDVGFEVTVECE
jgi:hypothetical protein